MAVGVSHLHFEFLIAAEDNWHDEQCHQFYNHPAKHGQRHRSCHVCPTSGGNEEGYQSAKGLPFNYMIVGYVVRSRGWNRSSCKKR